MWHAQKQITNHSQSDCLTYLLLLLIFIKLYYKTSRQKPPCAIADASLNPICSQIDSNDILWSGGYILSALSEA